MGYNGSNRRFRSGVIKKSSYNYGSRILGKMIAMPISLLSSAIFDSSHTSRLSSVSGSNISAKKEFDLHNWYILRLIKQLDDLKYAYLKNDYKNQLNSNEQLDIRIISLRKKVNKLFSIASISKIFPPLKKKIEAKIDDLYNNINSLSNRKTTPTINIQSTILHTYSDISVPVPEHTNIYLVFAKAYPYIMTKRMFKLKSNSVCEYFKSDAKSICVLQFDGFNLSFYDSVMMIASLDDFFVVGYSDVSCNMQQIPVMEEKLDAHVNYEDGIRKTYLHSCLDGTPDLRYNYNPQVFFVNYWYLDISFNSANLCLLITNGSLAKSIFNLVSKGTCNKSSDNL